MLTQVMVFPSTRRAEFVSVEIGSPGPEQILQEVTTSLISTGTELICYYGGQDENTHWSSYGQYPHYPGYSSVGVVAEVGGEVEGLAPGDRVFTTIPHRSAALVEVDGGWCTKIPDDISDEEAAWSSLAVITQSGVRRAEHALGETAVVIGLGPLGQLVCQYLRTLGLGCVIAIDASPQRVELALAHGADVGFSGPVAEAAEFVARQTGGEMARVVYDVTGHHGVLPEALPLVQQFGKLILLGDSPHPSRQHLTSDVISRQITIIGCLSKWLPPAQAYWTPQRQIELFYTYLQRGQMQVKDLITHRFPASRLPRVYRQLAADREQTLGVVIDWSVGGR
jgi:2-desacetyl-2-hydroxyethyl bacteriochlorophyllide A dehydrogenase